MGTLLFDDTTGNVQFMHTNLNCVLLYVSLNFAACIVLSSVDLGRCYFRPGAILLETWGVGGGGCLSPQLWLAMLACLALPCMEGTGRGGADMKMLRIN